MGQQIRKLLLDVGIRRASGAYQYLCSALGMVLDGAHPGPELWDALARKYGKCAVNVRSVCRNGIQKAYHNDPEAFCAALDDIYFTSPKTRDFIMAVANCLRQPKP